MATIKGNNVGSVQLTSVPNEGSQENYTISGGSGAVYAFTRAKTITFIAQGLKPNTKYYPFFNDVYVGAFCSTADAPSLDSDGKVTSGSRTLQADALGNITGNFFLPANTFTSGSNIFKLVDNTDIRSGVTVADPIYGSAEAVYESGTFLKQNQNQSTISGVKRQAKTTPINPGTVDLNPPIECQTWYFEYTVTADRTGTFTITTNSASPPGGGPQVGGTLVPAGAVDSSTFVSTTANGDGTYDHLYSYSQGSRSVVFKQEWTGAKVSPDDAATETWLNSAFPLGAFRPSGLDSTATVIITKDWTLKGDVACPVHYGTKAPKRTDAIAQSFLVDGAKWRDGIFVTSIALYFKTVDHSSPVILELRELVNGVPGSEILPGASAVVPGYAVASSKDASVSTLFRFNQPIFLQSGMDYCFVVKTPSLGYNAWTSHIGKRDVLTEDIINMQSYSGTLFKSENDVTWVPAPLEDLKFDLFKADFETDITGEVVLTPKEITVDSNDDLFIDRDDGGISAPAVTSYYSTAQMLPLSYLSTTRDSKVLGMRLPLHGLVTGDNIYIRGVPVPTKVDAYNNIRADQLTGLKTVTVVDGDNITFDTSGDGSDKAANKTGRLDFDDLLGIINNTPGNFPAITSLEAAEQFINPDLNIPSSVPAATEAFAQPAMPLTISLNSFIVFTNVIVNEAVLDYLGHTIPNTTVTEKVKLAADDYSDLVEETFDGTTEFHRYTEPRLIGIPDNEDLHSAFLTDPDFSYPVSCKVTLELDSNNKDLSPVIDTSGITLTTKSFKIDNQGDDFDTISTISDFEDEAQNSELAANTGSALAKYKSEVAALDKPYNKLSMFVTGNCPSPATFDVYVRTSNDPITHIDQAWTYVPVIIEEEESTTPTNSPDASTINEWYYMINDVDLFFTFFDIKIVMRSTNSSVVPKIYGLRAFANIVLPELEETTE